MSTLDEIGLRKPPPVAAPNLPWVGVPLASHSPVGCDMSHVEAARNIESADAS